jgi:hypothetical protein
MPSRTSTETVVRAAVSATQMAKMLGLSRASFYAHVKRGTFFAPEYQAGSPRPIYTAELQLKNLDIKATQLGANGLYVIFNDRKPRNESSRAETTTGRRNTNGNIFTDLRQRLEGLGLSGLTDSQVEVAHASCFPHGTAGVSENDVLRVIYRHLRRSVSA